jgi:VanZ family protein
VAIKWAAILFALFIVLIIILADAGSLGILAAVNQIPFGDKAGHFLLYGILALLINLSLFRAFPQYRPSQIIIVSGFILFVLIGAEEYSQQYFARRSYDLVDLMFSYLGVIFFSWLAIRAQIM